MSQKKTTKRSATSGTKRSSAPRSRKPASKGRTKRSVPASEPGRRRNKQAAAVLLFSIAVLLGCMIVLPGAFFWNWIHNALGGLFGSCAILWPALLLYIAIITSMDREDVRLSGRVWLMVIIITLFCSAVYSFGSHSGAATVKDFGSQLTALYRMGVDGQGAGLFSGLLGIPVCAALDYAGARIFFVLAIFVGLMLLTGTTLIKFIRTLTKPVEKAAEAVNTVRENRQGEIIRSTDIDVPLDDGMPQHPVRSKTVKTPEEIPAGTPKNDKLERLKEAINPSIFGQDKKSEASVSKTDSEGIPVQMMLETPAHADDGAEAAQDFLKRKRKLDQEQKALETAVNGTTAPMDISVHQAEDSEGYHVPPVSMLNVTKEPDQQNVTSELQQNGQKLISVLKSFGVSAKIVDISRGPCVTRYELQPAAGVKISKITNLADDIAMNLAASGVRIEAPIPGKAAVGIEVPNKQKSIVRMRDLVESNAFVSAKSFLTVCLGRNIAGEVTVTDLAKMPHLLIAGTTGSGKSVCLNSFIISLLYKSTPEEVRFLMIDPKVVELSIYNGIPQLLVPVVTDPRKAAGALGWAVTEMLKRYKIFAEYNVRDLKAYNALAKSCNYQTEDGLPMEHMPQIVIFIEELADLMMAAPNEVEDSICRLAQMARAAGMHLVIATQRPSVDVVTGLIKANIPSRIALSVSSQVDSRTIIDIGGAEKLLGNGDMLFSPVGTQKPIRVQGAFVSDSEIESIVEYIKKSGEGEYDQKIADEIEKNAVAEKGSDSASQSDNDQDPMMEDAIKCVVEAGQASTSLLQRRLRLGYARAGRLIDNMEQMGVVGPHEGSKPRKVLITYQQWLERSMQKGDAPEQKPEEASSKENS